MDKSSLVGIFLALGGILAGLLLEGGNFRQIPPADRGDDCVRRHSRGGDAAVSVARCTAGSQASSFRFFQPDQQSADHDPSAVKFAQKARKEGIVSLDAKRTRFQDPFLKKSLMLAVDGTEPQELQKMMELELTIRPSMRTTSPRSLNRREDTLPRSESSARSWG